MKRFLIYSLMTVTLFFGVARLGVSDTVQKTTVSANVNNQNHDDSLFQLSATDFGLAGGVGTEQFRLQNLFQQTSFRLLSFSSNAFRVANSIQLSHRQYLVSVTNFLLKSAFRQLDGYYLYYLRKILI